jgi:LemA protein
MTILGIVVALLAVALAWYYNHLIAARNLARQGFADVDVQLKRRADLVPAFVESVRAYAAYERVLLENVTQLRTQAHNMTTSLEEKRFSAERDLALGLERILLLQETYPALKADENFRDLSAQLVEIEEHLQYARRFYNGAVKQYLTRLESFPDILVARLFRFAPLPFFNTEDRDNVKVSL